MGQKVENVTPSPLSLLLLLSYFQPLEGDHWILLFKNIVVVLRLHIWDLSIINVFIFSLYSVSSTYFKAATTSDKFFNMSFTAYFINYLATFFLN